MQKKIKKNKNKFKEHKKKLIAFIWKHLRTLPAGKKLTATTFFTYFLFDFFLENPAPHKILKQTKTPTPIKF